MPLDAKRVLRFDHLFVCVAGARGFARAVGAGTARLARSSRALIGRLAQLEGRLLEGVEALAAQQPGLAQGVEEAGVGNDCHIRRLDM